MFCRENKIFRRFFDIFLNSLKLNLNMPAHARQSKTYVKCEKSC